jgi:hypothetical protein
MKIIVEDHVASVGRHHLVDLLAQVGRHHLVDLLAQVGCRHLVDRLDLFVVGRPDLAQVGRHR